MASDLTSRLGGARSSLAFKAPVRCATTANITLSGFQTIDGITPASGDTNLRILVKDQTNAVNNGIYEMASGAWSRAKDFDGNDDFVKGTRIYVANGSTNGDTAWVVTTADPITVGTSSISFSAPTDEATTAAAEAATSAAAAATSASAAATSASNASTSASAASTSASAASTSASNASTSASNASTSASAAATSASNASTSETNAASSASAASSSASAAATSAANAAAAAGFTWTFSSNTTMAEPGAGTVRFNHATLSSVTAIAIDDLSADSGNPDVSSRILTWDDSTNDDKGTLLWRYGTSVYAEYTVTGLTDNSGWTELAVTYVGHSGSISNGNTLISSFTRSGDKGLDGAGSGDVVGPGSATDNALARFDTTTGKLLQNSGVTVDDNAVVAGVTRITASHATDYAARFVNTQDAASLLEVARFEGDRATPTDGDSMQVGFYLSNDAGTQIEAARMTWTLSDVTAGTEDSALLWMLYTGGSPEYFLRLESTTLSPASNNLIALGSTSVGWADLHLASGGVINWANGEVTLTETDANTLTLAGGTLVLPASGLQVGSSNPFSDSSGTLTLQNVDAIDATTEATIEAALDSLPNVLVTATGGTTARSLAAHFADHVSVLDFGAVGDASTDDTTAIQAAIDSGAKAIYFPGDKTYKVTATITMTDLVGVHIYGDGDGSNGLGSSKIYWAGAANGTIFEMLSCQSCLVEGIAFQGIYGGLESNPGIGISFTGLNATGPTHWNRIRDCSVSAINGTPGYAIYLGSATDDDIADNLFENILIANVKTALYQEGTQTVHNPLIKIMALDYSVKGFVFVEGDGRVDKCSFFPTSAATADVEVATGMLWFTSRDAYHEIPSGYSSVGYSFPTGSRAYATTLDNCRVLWDRASGTVINYLQQGPLSIEGCSFDGSGTGTITVTNGAATNQPFVFDGNYLATNITKAFTGSIERTIQGPVDIVGALRPSTSDGGALGSASLMWSDLFLASGGIINFNNGDVTITHSSNALTWQGATGGYLFSDAVIPQLSDGAALGSTANMWADLFLASGGVINWNNGDVTATHSANTLAFAGASSGYTFDAVTTITSAGAPALSVGANGATNPVLQINASAASVATGVAITGAAAASRAALAAISSGTDEGLSIDAKGAGTIRLGATSTGAVEFSRNAVPTASDGAALGTSSLMWADLFLASGGVLNFNAGDVTITHSANALTFQGADFGYLFSNLIVPQVSDGAALGSTANMWSDLFLASGGVINFNNGDVTITHSSNALAIAGGVTALDASSTVGGSVIKTVGKETIFVPAAAMTSRTTNGAAAGTTELTTNDVMLSSLDFDQTTEEGAGFFIAMPKSWNESTVTFKPFWTAASGSGGVVWGLAAYAFSDDDALDTAVSGQQTSTDTLIATNDMHIGPESSAITIGGTPAEGDMVYFEITREVANGSDTLSGDAKLLGVHVYITTNASTDA